MRGALSRDGRGHAVAVALALSTSAGGMLDECRLDECAESIDPSSTCAQLHAVWIFTMAILSSGATAQAGGSNSATSAGSPIHTQTKPPDSRTG